jgi:hypothetical protein
VGLIELDLGLGEVIRIGSLAESGHRAIIGAMQRLRKMASSDFRRHCISKVCLVKF